MKYVHNIFVLLKITDHNAKSGKVPQCLQRFHIECGKGNPFEKEFL
jgi:hypothetical protein